MFVQLKACSKVEQQVAEMIDSLGLSHKRDAQAHTLSGGMKRKLSVGIALIGNPRVSKNFIAIEMLLTFTVLNVHFISLVKRVHLMCIKTPIIKFNSSTVLLYALHFPI